MKRVLFLAAIFLVVTSLLFIAGCSDDDDNGTGSTTKETGDINDPDFQMVEDLTGEVDDMIGYMFDYVGSMVDTIMAMNPTKIDSEFLKDRNSFAAADSVFITYHSNTGYWYAYISEVDTFMIDTSMEIESMVVEDSIQFRHGANVVQWPDSLLLTSITNGVSVTFSGTYLGESDGVTARQLVTVTGDSIFTNGMVTINGNQNVDMNISEIYNVGTGDSCSFGVSLATTITNIVMNVMVMEDCPESGNIRHTGNINISCTGDTTFTYNDGWLITQAFHDGLIDVVFENSTTRWTFTDTCGSGGPTVSEQDLLRFND